MEEKKLFKYEIYKLEHPEKADENKKYQYVIKSNYIKGDAEMKERYRKIMKERRKITIKCEICNKEIPKDTINRHNNTKNHKYNIALKELEDLKKK